MNNVYESTENSLCFVLTEGGSHFEHLLNWKNLLLTWSKCLTEQLKRTNILDFITLTFWHFHEHLVSCSSRSLNYPFKHFLLYLYLYISFMLMICPILWLPPIIWWNKVLWLILLVQIIRYDWKACIVVIAIITFFELKFCSVNIVKRVWAYM